MRIEDVLRFASQALTGHRGRTALMLLAMAIGVAAVVMLTALGEGARRYVVNEFTAIGSHLLIVFPGRSETTGGAPPVMGETPQDLTLDDAAALLRSSAINRMAPVVVGEAPVSWRERSRDVFIIGTTADMYDLRQLQMSVGKFLPAGDAQRGASVVVLGHKLKQELLGHRQALGEWVRIGDRRYRVIGVLADQGEALGVHIRDSAFIPVASAQALFDTESLFRILVQAKGRDSIANAKQAIEDIIRIRHDGEDDVTVITQDAILATFDRILTALTLTVGGIAAISLAVAGILIMNVMLVAVSQRTSEIGLLKALGAPNHEILTLFLSEAGMLSLLGGGIGLLVGWIGTVVLAGVFPSFPVAAPVWAMVGGLTVALATGLLFGFLPARRAARLDAVQALSRR